jgi:hypothetical protein
MHVVVNTEESIGKTVGRRTRPNPLVVFAGEQEACREWSDAGFFPRIRKGVYRFHSHEEADQWLMDHLTRKPEN